MAAMLFVWFAGVTGAIQAFMILLGIALCLCLIFGPLVTESKELFIRLLKWLGPIIFVLFSVASCMPSEKTTYMMAGAYVGQKVLIESDASKKVYSIINQKLDSYMTKDTLDMAEKVVRNTTEKVEEMAVDAAKEKVKEVVNKDEEKT